jgi:hypothetical protein
MEILQAKRDCQDRVHSFQLVLGTIRWEARPLERWPKMLKMKPAQGGHEAGVHSDQMILMMARREAGPCERLSKTPKVELENNSRKPRDLVRKLA